MQHYIHNTLKYCNSYEQFIQRKNLGINTLFNTQYFFFFNFLLVRHKLYIEYFFVFTLYFLAFLIHTTTYYSLIEDANPIEQSKSFFLYFTIIHLVMSNLSFNLYYNKVERVIRNKNYDYNLCNKAMKPFNWFVNLIINIVMLMSFLLIAVIALQTGLKMSSFLSQITH